MSSLTHNHRVWSAAASLRFGLRQNETLMVGVLLLWQFISWNLNQYFFTWIQQIRWNSFKRWTYFDEMVGAGVYNETHIIICVLRCILGLSSRWNVGSEFLTRPSFSKAHQNVCQPRYQIVILPTFCRITFTCPQTTYLNLLYSVVGLPCRWRRY